MIDDEMDGSATFTFSNAQANNKSNNSDHVSSGLREVKKLDFPRKQSPDDFRPMLVSRLDGAS